ncbi:MAG TPA: KUP/HAK/KT family potassium transporter [Myxococcota bacterium]|nr:KUP/HAK/KT family potassium transporter [Myxococcota bacterium]
MTPVPRQARLFPLALGALGVVYGDIGTSPLYAMKETFFGTHPLSRSLPEVLGILSLVFWALTLVVSLKYLIFILQADHNGEGGVFALIAQIRGQGGPGPGSGPGKARRRGWIIGVILLGAALIYGEGIITPAISVLSAYEGLKVATTALQPLVVPLTLVTLLLLFLFQRVGTGRVGRAFGPIMTLWFLVIGAAGVYWFVRHPELIQAVDPRWAVRLLATHGLDSLWVLGAVVLVITGCEALYADLGHFGRKPIRLAWFGLAYPALLLNYFGQGARLLEPGAIPRDNLFFSLFPQEPWILYPVVALAALATVIASQALISGAFSLTRQAMALGYFPRLAIVNTSAAMPGQVYMPGVNWLLFAGCALLVVSFQSSSKLAAAYGVAVTGTMTITTFAFYHVARGWGWRAWVAGPLCAALLLVDLAFFTSTSVKFVQGGWIPLVIAAGLYLLMRTWQWGRALLAQAYARFPRMGLTRLVELKQQLIDSPERRVAYAGRTLAEVDRAIVFLTSRAFPTPDDPCPVGVRIFMKRTGALPKHVTLLHVDQQSRPYVPEEERHTVVQLGGRVVSVHARYGYMEPPDVPALLLELKKRGLIKINQKRWTVQTGEEEILLEADLPTLRRLAMRFFQLILRISTPADRYFGLREYAGRAKTVVPIQVGAQGSRIVIFDDVAD